MGTLAAGSLALVAVTHLQANDRAAKATPTPTTVPTVTATRVTTVTIVVTVTPSS
ncbi:MAG TPA: hypothetical protein VK457_14295 [Chloroflexota bacterium]|nr:hypothetical protein [Chloroflexota bacterium]